MKTIKSSTITDVSMDTITKSNFGMLVIIIIMALFSTLVLSSTNMLLKETMLLIMTWGVGPITLLIFLGQIFFQTMFED